MWNNLPLVLAQSDPAPNVNPAVNPSPSNTNTTSTTEQSPNPATQTDGKANTEDPSPWGFMMPIVLMIVLMYLLLFLPQRKERKRRDSMIGELQKTDKVQTIGGLIGTVVEVRDHEVLLKIDENNNTKIHVTKGAIQAVINKKDKD